MVISHFSRQMHSIDFLIAFDNGAGCRRVVGVPMLAGWMYAKFKLVVVARLGMS